MNPERSLLTDAERAELEDTALVRHRFEEQYASLEQQQQTAAFGMWVFLATEVMFFGALFLSLGVYRTMYGEAFEKGSEKLNWMIGGINTVVLLVSSLMAVLAVHYARLGKRGPLMIFLALTALLGVAFLCLKGLEYYTDYVEYLIPGWRFNDAAWVGREGLRPDQVREVKLFLILYWIMTGLHGLHVIIGVGAMLMMLWYAWRRSFSAEYYWPVDVTALYWHFVDIVWIFLLPMLYLLGTHYW
jgi:cytochrome c oxidase subunit 3